MSDNRIGEIDKRISELKRERAELSDPKREEVRALYGELERVLDRLEDLGEDVSNGDNYAIHIVGTRFSYTHGIGLADR